ncbi:MAG: hypothetical protein ACTSRZ_11275 [Promethearchaeota archaeon]
MKRKTHFKYLILIALFSIMMITIINTNSSQSSRNSIYQINYKEASNIVDNIDNIYIKNLERNVDCGIYGIVTISESLELYNNGSDIITSFYYTIENIYEDNIKYISAATESDASLPIIESLIRYNGLKTYIVYLNEPLYAKSSTTIKIKLACIDLLTISGSTSTQEIQISLNLAPYLPYKIEKLDTTITAPIGSTMGTFNPETDAQGTSRIYHRSNLSKYYKEYISGSYTYSTDTFIEFVSITRKIYINPWGDIRVVEKHYINNTGKISVSSYKWAVPLDTQNITAYDDIGEITGLTMETEANNDGKTKNVTMTLTKNRSKMNGGTSVSYYIEYYLPLQNYFNSSIIKSTLKINLNLIKSHCLISQQKTMIYLYAGEKILKSSISPENVNFEENSLVLTFSDQNITYYAPKYVIIEYTANGFQILFRPLLFSILILVALSLYVSIKSKTKGREEEKAEFEEYIPLNEIREYLNLYEEINALRIELRELEDNLLRKKIAKREYSKERKTLENKLKDLQDEIKEFKNVVMQAGGKISKIIQNIDLKETELEAGIDGLKLHEQKYRKRKITSKKAYLTLREQMIKQIDKNQKEIDKLINELKSYLI